MDWQRLSRYAFWTALACVIIAIGSLFADSELMARIIEFSLSHPSPVSGCLRWWRCCFTCGDLPDSDGKPSGTTAQNILFLGVFFTAIALAAWRKG
jgi:hypothetical protein